MLSQEKNDWLQTVLKVNVHFADVKTDADTADGNKPLPLGESYAGEHERAAWRADMLPRKQDETDAEYKVRQDEYRAREDIVTHAYDDEERKKNTITVDDDGKMRDGTGKELNKNVLYAVDAKTGDMVINREENYVLRKMNDDGTPGDILPPVSKDPSKTPTENRFVDVAAAKARGESVRLEAHHHSSMLEGGDVAGAGFVGARDGFITSISNASGHYKPQFEHLLQVVEGLLKNGALLDKDIVNYRGEDLETVSPKGMALYEKVSPMLRALPDTRKELEDATKTLEADSLDENDVAELERTITKLGKKIETVSAAMAHLRKMGIGPSMTISPDAKVKYTHAKAGADGAEFRTASTDVMGVNEFLVGGNAIKGAGAASALNRESSPREAMLAELKEKATDGRLLDGKDYDPDAAEIAEGTAPAVDKAQWEAEAERATAALDQIDTADAFEDIFGEALDADEGEEDAPPLDDDAPVLGSLEEDDLGGELYATPDLEGEDAELADGIYATPDLDEDDLGGETYAAPDLEGEDTELEDGIYATPDLEEETPKQDGEIHATLDPEDDDSEAEDGTYAAVDFDDEDPVQDEDLDEGIYTAPDLEGEEQVSDDEEASTLTLRHGDAMGELGGENATPADHEASPREGSDLLKTNYAEVPDELEDQDTANT